MKQYICPNCGYVHEGAECPECGVFVNDDGEKILWKQFKLQPLRIPAGWTVKYNHFSEYDPQKDGAEYVFELVEDLLQLEYQNLLIDLGWYPDMDINGKYQLFLVDMTEERPFDTPLDVFESDSKQLILEKLEYWTSAGHYGKYLFVENFF
ncbi:MAG TPA: hypothetical protein DCO72_10865 [Ruminococcus sp.]|nr:hypothetical protein [Ruminococcus sp.]